MSRMEGTGVPDNAVQKMAVGLLHTPLQEEFANRPLVLQSKAVVLSDEGKGSQDESGTCKEAERK